jgi:hypothetical protein
MGLPPDTGPCGAFRQGPFLSPEARDAAQLTLAAVRLRRMAVLGMG